jgi:hypothetical protein
MQLQLHLTSAARSWLSKLEKETIGIWEELTKQFTSNFKSTYKRPASIEEVKACVQQRNETLRAYIQRWSIIKNSAVEVSDERAIDAFTLRLRQGDLVEQTVKMRATISEHDHQKMIEETDTVAKGGDPAITITTAPTAK